ncbi:MAG: tRNA uridine-5-carboxymethylaminomethyl(34) synthesis GTPase MnmE [Acidobacteriota bacterium]
MAIDTVFSPTDTIVAIATPPGRGGIGIVRISGSRAVDVAQAVLSTPHPLEPRRATRTFARAVGAAAQPGGGVRPGAAIDEVVATYFPSPHSYTTEDVVEIGAHGSPAGLREIVRSAVAAGARLAERGEFTFRAYLGGRIDLVQAEAVADLVDSVTPLQARVAFDQLEGTLTRAIGALDARLFDLVAKLEASIDFPDEGFHFVGAAEVVAALNEVRGGILRLLGSARMGRLVREGRQVAIVGKPNVGKSSLFNWLVGADRAIVTSVPGTTRDLLRESVDFEGVRLSLVDTAGIREVLDEVEREGVERARRAPAAADVVFVVLDASREVSVEDRDVLARTAAVRRVVVVNKTDLPRAWNRNLVREIEGDAVVEISLATGAGLPALRAATLGALEVDGALIDDPMVTNIRHEALLGLALASIERAMSGLETRGERLNEELMLADLAGARRAFEEVVGTRTPDDVLRAIFERFCIGK